MTKDQQFKEMVLVATHYRGGEVSRKAVRVKETPKRYRVIDGIHKNEVFDKKTGARIAAFNPYLTYRYRLEQPQ